MAINARASDLSPARILNFNSARGRWLTERAERESKTSNQGFLGVSLFVELNVAQEELSPLGLAVGDDSPIDHRSDDVVEKEVTSRSV